MSDAPSRPEIEAQMAAAEARGSTRLAEALGEMRTSFADVRTAFAGQDGRLGGIEGRLSAMEQSFHGLVNEVSRGFGQQQQQLTRLEKRINAVDAGLSALGAALADSTANIIAAIGAKP
jgi:hypothetical protein